MSEAASIASAPALLAAEDVHKAYRLGGQTLEILRGVTLSVRRGERVAIVGASGAGKSTLLNVLGGLDRPTSGRVWFDGADLYRLPPRALARRRGERLGFVFQAYHLLPELDLRENVLLPARIRLLGPAALRAARARADELLDRVGLGARRRHHPDELSGGEQQRAALARALMNDPELVLADEPTGNLDSVTGESVLHYLFELLREKRHTLLLVTHNEAVAARCDRTVRLQDGAMAEMKGGSVQPTTSNQQPTTNN